MENLPLLLTSTALWQGLLEVQIHRLQGLTGCTLHFHSEQQWADWPLAVNEPNFDRQSRLPGRTRQGWLLSAKTNWYDVWMEMTRDCLSARLPFHRVWYFVFTCPAEPSQRGHRLIRAWKHPLSFNEGAELNGTLKTRNALSASLATGALNCAVRLVVLLLKMFWTVALR